MIPTISQRKRDTLQSKVAREEREVEREVERVEKEKALTKEQRKYCKCLLDVNTVGKNGKKYNPYAVCAHSTKGSYKYCSEIYDFPKLTESQLKHYAILKNIQVDENDTRDSLLKKIYKWKREQGYDV
jgi:hypothetical protein